jgi:hypothetical protein
LRRKSQNQSNLNLRSRLKSLLSQLKRLGTHQHQRRLKNKLLILMMKQNLNLSSKKRSNHTPTATLKKTFYPRNLHHNLKRTIGSMIPLSQVLVLNHNGQNRAQSLRNLYLHPNQSRPIPDHQVSIR